MYLNSIIKARLKIRQTKNCIRSKFHLYIINKSSSKISAIYFFHIVFILFCYPHPVMASDCKLTLTVNSYVFTKLIPEKQSGTDQLI